MQSRLGLAVVLSAIVVLLCPHMGFAQGLRFDSETIVVKVKPDHIRITGTYTIVNDTPTDRPQRLYYPFPVDSLHPPAYNIEVMLGDSLVEFKASDIGILFSIPLPAEGSATFNVSYAQDCLDHTGCYILMTTSTWNVPLRKALFEIHIPPGIELVASSYEFDSVVEKDDAQIHRMERNDFMPDADLCVEWRIPGD